MERSSKTDLNRNEEQLNALIAKYHEEIKELRKENNSLRNLYDAIEHEAQNM